jgi:hypothetical protein
LVDNGLARFFPTEALEAIVGAVSLALRFMIETIPAESKCLYLIILFSCPFKGQAMRSNR